MTLPETSRPAPTVYFIDDSPNDVLLIRRLCESVGHHVRAYHSPRVFLQELKSDDHGCVVTDLMMPEMTGLQLHSELQKIGSNLPIIVVTGHADVETCRTALHNGVFDFVEKGFSPHDLLVVIRAAIEKSAKQKHDRELRDSYLHQLDALSPRERDVMELLVNGLSLKEIASALSISVQTASKHRINLFEKLGVNNEVKLLKLLIKIDPSHGQSDPTVAA